MRWQFDAVRDGAPRALFHGHPVVAGDLIIGGQNVNVKLTSSNVAYNSGTGRFTFDVTVQNLIPQPLGTTDGTTLAPGGVSVFFTSGPTVTDGTDSGQPAASTDIRPTEPAC